MQERQTVQKNIIYAALCELGDHPTADEVYRQVQLTRPGVSLATVYRVLNRMAEQGTILRISVDGGADRYDHRAARHFHVCCTVCGRVDDVVMPDPGDLVGAVTDAAGYRLESATVLLRGLCPSCQKSNHGDSSAF